MLKIYLADLVYDTVKTNYVVPLNVACIAAYVAERHAKDIDIKIFKYPHELEKFIKDAPPDILGMSNYSWNERLNQTFIKFAKQLNPEVLTVMGGPNIRTDRAGIEAYLKANAFLDYYILFEGEEPFGNLVDQVLVNRAQGVGRMSTPPLGCAALVDGRLHFEPLDLKNKSKEIDYPSPYLTGLLDTFLTDANMIPLFETNRGCPFGCIYCTWGIASRSKVRCRSLEVIHDELDYVAQKSAKQVNWFFCDANFGMFERDSDIAKKIRQLMDKNGYPINVTLWHSKNTGERNIEIAKTIKNSVGHIAIQSTDPEVLKACGRGNIKFEHLITQINFYKQNDLGVVTDILIGLPNETAKSHLNTLVEAFDLGFGKIYPYNIRLLPGSQYETEENRAKYGVKTKYRPIFGAYGVYDGQNIFEIEESVRATKDMSEAELESFKILHWLIYFCWNVGICKPVLRFAQENGINPGLALYKLASTEHPLLAEIFSQMKKQSIAEWHETKEEAIAFYEQQKNFDGMLHGFVKLNLLWIATVYQNPNIVSALMNELIRIIRLDIKADDNSFHNTLEKLVDVSNKLICVDLLQEEFSEKNIVSGEVLSYVLDHHHADLAMDSVAVEIYRDQQDVSFCHHHLNNGKKKDFSIQNLTRFIEMGGEKMLKNKIRLGS